MSNNNSKDYKEMLLEFTKDSYNTEIHIKNAVNSRMPSIATIITILFGTLAYFAKSLNSFEFSFIGLIFLICLASYFASLIFSLIFFYKCMFTYEYSYVATPIKIRKLLSETIQYNEKIEERNQLVEKNDAKNTLDLFGELFETLLDNYSSSVCVNRSNNRRKNAYFTKTLRSVYIGVLLLIVTACFYHLDRFYCINQKQVKHELCQKETKQMLEENDIQQFYCGDDDPKQEEPVRPVRPESELIIESEFPASEIETRVPKDTTEKKE